MNKGTCRSVLFNALERTGAHKPIVCEKDKSSTSQCMIWLPCCSASHAKMTWYTDSGWTIQKRTERRETYLRSCMDSTTASRHVVQRHLHHSAQQGTVRSNVSSACARSDRCPLCVSHCGCSDSTGSQIKCCHCQASMVILGLHACMLAASDDTPV